MTEGRPASSSEPESQTGPELSVVVPLFDEVDGVDELASALLGALPDIAAGGFEILLVDDGSTDSTWERVVAWHASDSRVRGLRLSRNFGHQAAVTAGLEHAVGDVVVVMDGDMQDDPSVIAAFLDNHRQGYDVVYAIRVGRKEAWWKRLGYWAHYRLGARLGEVSLPVDAGDFGLMSREVVDVLNGMPERLRYVRGLRAWVGFKQVGIPVERADRASGTSKYTLSGLFRLSVDGLLGFSVVPLRLSIYAGVVIIVVAFGYGGFVLVDRLVTGAPPQGFASLALLSLVLNGTVLVMLGIVGEYVGRIYLEVKARPIYIVRERLMGADNG
jgi:polyisoprenyl-phosphate glycosyltransferase